MRGPVACVGIRRQPDMLLRVSCPCLQVRDGQGRKMSKSIGNVVDPVEVISQYGTDALRFTLATGETTLIFLLHDSMRSEQAPLLTSENAAQQVSHQPVLLQILQRCLRRYSPIVHVNQSLPCTSEVPGL